MAAVTFYCFMMQYLNEDTPRGDLARDLQYEQERSLWNDQDLNEISTWFQLRQYLVFNKACNECLETAELCWQEYEKTRIMSENR